MSMSDQERRAIHALIKAARRMQRRVEEHYKHGYANLDATRNPSARGRTMSWYRSPEFQVKAIASAILVVLIGIVVTAIVQGVAQTKERERALFEAGVNHGRDVEECIWYCTMAQPDIMRPRYTGRLVHHAWPLRPKCNCVLAAAEKDAE